LRITDSRKSALSCAILSSILLCALIQVNPSSADPDYWPTESWLTSTPEEQGMSSAKLQEMMDYIESDYYIIHSIVVVRNGYIVWEEYPSTGYGEDTLHLLFSVTKSFTSCLTGIAIDQGYIGGVSERMLSFFPNRTVENLEGGKEGITLENLLMMRSGMFWDESSAPYDSPENGIYHINREDGLQWCLDLPMVAEPGQLWHYNTGSSHILSGVIHSATGSSTLDFATENLFNPLGITNVIWGRDMGTTYKGGFDLQLTPRDMAKFGLLYLNGGLWDGRQIVSSSWVETSTSSLTRLNDDQGYGYQWWTMPEVGVFHASGLYGQGIFVSPDEDIVFVLTAGISPSQHGLEHRLMTDYVLEAVVEEEAPPPSDDGGDSSPRGIPGFPNIATIIGVSIGLTLIFRRKH
jgi:CubicO group peptidase (beta-lactamase class C family)